MSQNRFCLLHVSGGGFRTEFKGEISFKSALFENEPKIFFDGDLSKVSFIDANISEVRFGDNVSWGSKDDYRIIDEQKLDRLDKISLGSVVRVYRRLRKNYENAYRYEESDKFYIREMELQRGYKEVNYEVRLNDIFRRNLSLIGLYYHISRYGQDYTRPALLAISFLSILALIKLMHLNPSHFFTAFGYKGLTFVGQAFVNALSDIFQVKGQDLEGQIIRLLTIPILGGLFIAAIRKRFERRSNK